MIIQPAFTRFYEMLNIKLFSIPEYQRHYSWQKKQRKDLFDDIVKLREQWLKDKERTHFMATFVCLKTKPETLGCQEFYTYDVIDGQQRLTTMIILLKAISKALLKTQDRNSEFEAMTLDNLLVKQDRRIIILQNNHDNPGILRNYLEEGNGPDEDSIKTEADINLREAILECEGWVNTFPDVLQLLRLIKNNIVCIFQELEDKGAAYTIFEVLNSRGLVVDCLDKCKSLLMGLLYEHAGGKENDIFKAHTDELQNSWSHIYNYIGRQYIPGEEIVRFTATLLKTESEGGRPLSEEDALSFFKEYCTKNSDNNLNIKQIINSTQWLVKIAARLSELYGNKRLKAVTSVTQARLLAVAIKLREGLSNEERSKLLEQWERTTFKIYGLMRKDSRTKVGDYVRLAKKILKEPSLTFVEILHEIAEIGKDTPIETAVSNQLRSDNCYEGWQTELRYFFYRYDEYLAAKENHILDEVSWKEIWAATPNSSIEHILPQTLTPSDSPQDWTNYFTDADYKDLLNSIGNLCLVPPPKQQILYNHTFDIKLPIYKGINLMLIKEIVTDDNGDTRTEWDKYVIEHRRDKLIEFAIDQWKDL